MAIQHLGAALPSRIGQVLRVAQIERMARGNLADPAPRLSDLPERRRTQTSSSVSGMVPKILRICCRRDESALWTSSSTGRHANRTFDVPDVHEREQGRQELIRPVRVASVVPMVVPDAPRPDEIVYALAMTTGSRIHARIGGLEMKDVKGEDGLR
jgi:hypothetical protein